MRVAICIEFDQTMAETLLPGTLERIGEYVLFREVVFQCESIWNHLEVIGETDYDCDFLLEEFHDEVFHQSIKVEEV